MAVFDYPEQLLPQAIEFGTIKAGVGHRSPLNSAFESVIFPGERWRISLTLPQWKARSAKAALAEAFFGRLAGGVDRVRMRHFLRPVPVGTMRGTPTLQATATQGALSLVLNATGTLLAGDFIKAGGQLFQCFADCESAAGTLTVPLVQRVRTQLNAGTAVEWDRPTFLAIYPAFSTAAGYRPGAAVPVQCDLEEVFT